MGTRGTCSSCGGVDRPLCEECEENICTYCHGPEQTHDFEPDIEGDPNRAERERLNKASRGER